MKPDIFSRIVNKHEIEYIHVDSYRKNVLGTDLELLKEYVMWCNSPIIGNNSVKDKKSAEAILKTGARYFSVARAAIKDNQIFQKITSY